MKPDKQRRRIPVGRSRIDKVCLDAVRLTKDRYVALASILVAVLYDLIGKSTK